MKAIQEIMFNRYRNIFEIAYYIGSGVIFVSQLKAVVGLRHETQLWRIINILSEWDLIEKVRFKRRIVLVLKPLALKLLTSQKNSRKISVTTRSIQRSSFMSGSVQYYLSGHEIINLNNLNDVRYNTTFFRQSNSNSVFTNMMTILANEKMDVSSLMTELKCINENTGNDDIISSAAKSNIFIVGIKKVDPLVLSLEVAVMDLRFIDNKKAIFKLSELLVYLQSVAGNNLLIKNRKRLEYVVNIFVQNSRKKKYITNQLYKLERKLYDAGVSFNFLNIEVTNLNLTQNVFSNASLD